MKSNWSIPDSELRDLQWTVDVVGDVDGFPGPDAIIGYSYYVMEGDEEVACLPTENRAKLVSRSPKMLDLLLEIRRIHAAYADDSIREFGEVISESVLPKIEAILKDIGDV